MMNSSHNSRELAIATNADVGRRYVAVRSTIKAVTFFAWLIGTTAQAQVLPKIEIVPQIAHSSTVSSIAFSRDGARVLSGGSNIKLWDTASWQLLRTFEDHSTVVDSVSLSPDGARALSGSRDGTVRLWDTASGVLLRTIKGHSGTVWSVAFSPDGVHMLSGGEDKTIKLWNSGTGELLRTFEGHSKTVNSIAFSPDGKRALSGSYDNTVKVWDTTTSTVLQNLEGHLGRVTSVAFSPDGSHVLSGSSDMTLKLWNAVTGALVQTFEQDTGTIYAVAFSPDGALVLSGSRDKMVKLWDAATGVLLRTFEGHSDWVWSVAFSPDGAHVLSGGRDNRIMRWDSATGVLQQIFAGNTDWVLSVASSRDDTRVLSGSGDGTLKLWDAASGVLLQTLEGHSRSLDGLSPWVMSSVFSPDGTKVLSAGWDGTLKMWDAATGLMVRSFERQPASVGSVAFSPDGVHVLSGSNTLKLWDAGSGRLLRTFEGHSDRVNSVAFSPDGAGVLSSGGDGMKLWDVATGVVVRTFEGQSTWVGSVAFSPDGTHVLSNGRDGMKLWNVATGLVVRNFEPRSAAVASVAFSPDGALVLAGSYDNKLTVWDVATGGLLRTFVGHSAVVDSVAFSHGGRRVVSGSSDSTVRVWDVATGAQIALFIASREGEWLTMTPHGFFAASQRETEMLAIVRKFELTTIDQVHQSFFNPDLVREALAGDPNGEVKEAAAALNLEKVLDSGPAPLVEVTSYAADGQSSLDLVAVSARITDKSKGVGRIEWRVNGVTAAVAAKPEGSGPVYTIEREVALDPGDNTIEVVAYNGSNLLASLPARTPVKYTGPPDQVKPKLHVLAIGINKYVDKGWIDPDVLRTRKFRALKLAVKDAEVFGSEMKRAGAQMYQEVIVTPVLDKEATRENLDRVIDRLAKDIHPRDTFILFAAAHGSSEKGRFYLIPQDYQGGPGALQERAIGQDKLQDWLANRIKARKAVILLDTCESGALIAGHLRSRTEEAASEAGVGRLHEATGRPVLTAAATGQFAYEGVVADSGERHGIFTWALLGALRKGDTNLNRKIELSELVAYVQSEVPKIAAKHRGQGRAETAAPKRSGQAARFGSRGEDFELVGIMQ